MKTIITKCKLPKTYFRTHYVGSYKYLSLLQAETNAIIINLDNAPVHSLAEMKRFIEGMLCHVSWDISPESVTDRHKSAVMNLIKAIDKNDLGHLIPNYK